jgi:hypothetical protein
MGNPINNLGDYNKVRIDLQNAGGSMEKLYKNISDTAVAEAAPGLLLTGGAIVAGVIGIVMLGKKGIVFMKDRIEKIKNVPALKKEFVEMVESVIRKEEGKDLAEDDME